MRTARSRDPRRVRYAVVGLGHIAQVAVLPAFAHARRNSELVALVSEDTTKRQKLSRRYRVPLAFPYDEYDTRLREGGIDAVYIALPNDMHRAFAERAARAGVHVLCEKPLAPTVRDCQAMIRDRRSARRQAHDRLSAPLRRGEPGRGRARRGAAGWASSVSSTPSSPCRRGRGTSVSRRSAPAARSTTSASTASTPRATSSGPSPASSRRSQCAEAADASRRSRKR